LPAKHDELDKMNRKRRYKTMKYRSVSSYARGDLQPVPTAVYTIVNLSLSSNLISHRPPLRCKLQKPIMMPLADA